MKYNFGSSNIVTCYLKEVLHSFNLPIIPVYTDDTILIEDRVYIKDNRIVKYTDGEFKELAIYSYNRPIINLTRNLIINSSKYDSYTHRYLGDYLRFLRDYSKVDLMGLYNCFGNETPKKIDYSLEFNKVYVSSSRDHSVSVLDSEGNVQYDDEGHIIVETDSEGNTLYWRYNYEELDEEGNPTIEYYTEKSSRSEKTASINFTINTDNSNYDYYIVPVKFNKTYTIALTAESKYELACILYNDIFISDTPDELIRQSYQCVNGSNFTTPYVYSTELECSKDLWHKEKDLRLLLKLPKGTETSIVILEGNYVACANILDGTYISNYSYDTNELPSVYFSKNSLLSLDDKISYPFADRLVEYIFGNAITNNDEISDNIERVQNIIYANKSLDGYFGIWDKKLRNNIYKETLKEDITKGNSLKYGNTLYELAIDSEGNHILDSEGNLVWEPIDKAPKRFIDIYSDITGYVDKDVESLLRLL